MSAAVRGEPPLPMPLDGCTTCARLAASRAYHRRRHDLIRVTDVNVLMRSHQRQQHQPGGRVSP